MLGDTELICTLYLCIDSDCLFHRLLLLCESVCGIADCLLPRPFTLVQGIHQDKYFETMWQCNIFKANYMLAMGPLMTAIMVWKNSLVFHSLDKLTSMYSDADSYIFNVQKLIFDWSMWIFLAICLQVSPRLPSFDGTSLSLGSHPEQAHQVTSKKEA